MIAHVLRPGALAALVLAAAAGPAVAAEEPEGESSREAQAAPAAESAAVSASEAPGSPEPGHAEAPSPYATVIIGRRDPEGLSAQQTRREEIARQGAQSAAEILERMAAVNATTGSRGERIFTLRGFDQRQSVVLLDGAPFYIPYDGQVDLAMFPATALDQVTVLKGPVSVVYGPNGLGGAVSLVTRQPGTGPLVSATVEGGGVEAIRFAAGHSARIGPVSWDLYGGFNDRGGFPLSRQFKATPQEDGGIRANSDQHLWNAGGDVGLSLGSDHQLRVSALFFDGSRGVPPSGVDEVPRFWRFSTWRALGTALSHTGKYGAQWTIDELVFVRRFDNLLDGYDDATYATQVTARAMHSWYHDWVLGGRVRSEYRRPRTALGDLAVRLWLGLQHDLHTDDATSGDGRDAYSRTLLTIAPELEVTPSQRWRATASCQGDIEIPGQLPQQQLKTGWGLGPLVALRYEPWDTFMVRGTVARRTRFATLRERFSSAFGSRLPNPDLTTEAAWHFGVDASWRPARWLRLDGSVFDAEVSQLVERVYLGDGVEQFQNIGSARMLGAELAVRLRPHRTFELFAGYLWLDARRTHTEDERLAYRPAHRGTAGALFQPLRLLELSTYLRVVGPQAFQDPNTRVWGTLGTYAVLDARAEVRLTRWFALWLRGTNLLDYNYQTEFGFPDPGREIWLGARLVNDPGDVADGGWRRND